MTAELQDLGDRLIVWNGNGARRGALTPQFYDTLAQALDRAAAPQVRSVILTSRDDFFCAGGDLNVLIERRRLSAQERRDKIDALHDLVRAIRACPVPVIAAIKGGAAGAGMSLALACDMIIAAQDAKFTAAYVKAGLVPDAGLTSALARLVPRSLAMELCLLGRPITAQRLADLGVVNLLCDADQVLPQAHALADALARGPRQAQGVIRGLVSTAYETTEAQALNLERDAMAAAAAAPEAGIGIAAFLAKQRPDFSDPQPE